MLCLDKTGTITSGRMEVEGTHPLPVEGVSLGAGSDEAAVPVDTTVLDLHWLVARATSADANETRQALLNYCADRPVEVSEPLSVIPFSSSKKWSGASFAQGSYVMGAPRSLCSLIAPFRRSRTVWLSLPIPVACSWWRAWTALRPTAIWWARPSPWAL